MFVLVCLLCRTAFAQPAATSGQSVSIAEQDTVAEYLERLNLKSLLLDHLTARMKSTDGTGPERLKLAERLGRLYASMLAETSDPVAREDLVHRSEELLKTVPTARAYDLRINLIRQRYSIAEEQAEKYRLRLVDETARAEAERMMKTVRPQLEALVAELTQREEALQKGMDADASSAERIEQEIGSVRRWKSMALYFGGWAAYYGSWLSGVPAGAMDAEKYFGAIIAGGGTPNVPGIEKLNNELLRHEHIARSVGGVALCESLQGHDVMALLWLDTLRDAKGVPESLRDQMLRWRVTVLADAGRWADVEREVRLAREGGDAVKIPTNATKNGGVLPVASARLLAVRAMEASVKGAGDAAGVVQQLARLAVGDLIARKEIAAVVDIASRFGVDTLGNDGFVPGYVRGVKVFQETVGSAKAAGANLDEPLTDIGMINGCADAARLLLAAAGSGDAREFPKERAQAMTTAARALFLAGKLRDAAEKFAGASEAARDAGDTHGAQESLWLAVVSLDKALKVEKSQAEKLALEERSEQMAALFIKQHPGTDRAAQLTLRQLAQGEKYDEETIRALSGVGKDSPVYEASRRQLARLLYRAFRAATTADKQYASSRYLKVADEVLVMDRLAAEKSNGTDAKAKSERLIGTARQMLDAILGVPNPDAAKAELVLGAAKKIVYTDENLLAPHLDEIHLCEAQIFLARGELDAADKIVDDLRAKMDVAKAGSDEFVNARRFHSAGRRVLLQNAESRMRQAVKDEDKLAAAKRVLKHGVPVLDELGAGTMNDTGVLSMHGRVAEAAGIVYRSTKDRSALDVAVRLDRAVLLVKPNLTENLMRLAENSEAAGDTKTATDCWRTLATGAEAETPTWARAKFELFRLLLLSDQQAGTTAIQQHLVLHPTGPEPWHGKIVDLAARHGISPTTQAPSSGGAP